MFLQKWNLFGFRLSKSLRLLSGSIIGVLCIVIGGAFTAMFLFWDDTPYARQVQGFLGESAPALETYLKTNGFTYTCAGTVCSFELKVPKHRSHTAKMVKGTYEIMAKDNTIGSITTTEFCHADGNVDLKLGCSNR